MTLQSSFCSIRCLVLRLGVVACASLGPLSSAQEPAAGRQGLIALKAARLFDGKTKTLAVNGVVIVEGDKIVDAGSNVAIPPDAQVIDLGDATLSPGFMDAHTHITLDYTNYQATRLREMQISTSAKAYSVIPAARATVEAGFTTVRDVGARTYR